MTAVDEFIENRELFLTSKVVPTASIEELYSLLDDNAKQKPPTRKPTKQKRANNQKEKIEYAWKKSASLFNQAIHEICRCAAFTSSGYYKLTVSTVNEFSSSDSYLEDINSSSLDNFVNKFSTLCVSAPTIPVTHYYTSSEIMASFLTPRSFGIRCNSSIFIASFIQQFVKQLQPVLLIES